MGSVVRRVLKSNVLTEAELAKISAASRSVAGLPLNSNSTMIERASPTATLACCVIVLPLNDAEARSIMVELLFNGKPATDLLAAEIFANSASVSTFDFSTRLTTEPIGQYFPEQGIYYLRSIAPGNYQVRIDFIADRAIGRNQGDFVGDVKATVAVDGSMGFVSLDLYKVFVLTSPVSTGSTLDREALQRGTFILVPQKFNTGNILFEWNGIPEATEYRVSLSEVEVVLPGLTTPIVTRKQILVNKYLVDLEPNAEGKFYHFSVTARNSDGLIVGQMISRSTSGGWSDSFRFSVTS